MDYKATLRLRRPLQDNIMGFHFLVLAILLFCSCEDRKAKENMTLLQGEWQAVGEADLDAYIFGENNQCINRAGFFTKRV